MNLTPEQKAELVKAACEMSMYDAFLEHVSARTWDKATPEFFNWVLDARRDAASGRWTETEARMVMLFEIEALS